MPESETPSEESEIQKVSIDFLDVDPALADSLISKLDDQQIIKQHIIWEIPADSNFDFSNIEGGGFIIDANLTQLNQIKPKLDSANKIKPYFFLNPTGKIIGDQENLSQELLSLQSKKTLKRFQNVISRVNQSKKLTGVVLPFSESEFKLDIGALKEEKPAFIESYIELLKTNREKLNLFALSVGNILKLDSSYFRKRLSQFTKQGLPIIILEEDSIQQVNDLRELLKQYEFNGLIGVRTKDQNKIESYIKKGADFTVIKYHPNIYNEIETKASLDGINKEEFSYSIKRNLLAKTWMRNGLLSRDSLIQQDTLIQKVSKNELKSLHYNIIQESIVLVNNKILPISNTKKSIDVYTTGDVSRFLRTLKKYIGYSPVKFKYADVKLLSKIKSTQKKTVLLLENIKLDTCSKELQKTIIESAKNKNVITVNVGNPSNLILLYEADNLIYLSQFSDYDQYTLAKQIGGVYSFKGKLAWNHKELGKHAGERVNRIRLGRGIPEEVGLNSDTLSQINFLVNRAMNGRAFPGCQVMVIKDGQIVYDKNFGHQTYRRENAINDNDVYDIASLTKVVSTTMAAMKLYEMKHYGLQDSLYNYLPEDTLKDHLRRKSSIRNIRFDELLVHKSGLPAGAPIIQYLDYVDRQKEIGRYDRYYCDEKDDTIFCVEIAKGYYLDGSYQDSMWLRLNSIYLNKKKPYKYSDVNMNLLYRLFKSIIQKKNLVRERPNSSYDQYARFVDSCFYRPLEMKKTGYLPRRRLDTMDIVPTEVDKWWRNQELRGYVHDPNAALYGGIAGNAGIFSNKSDLAILFQMLLDGGTYDGKRYLKESTVELFTNAYEGSHRGLGFNKQTRDKDEFGISKKAPVSLFGHTGFTGTCVWADPSNDIIFIFLSNRVYPKVNKRIYKFGVRKNIHDFIYRSLME